MMKRLTILALLATGCPVDSKADLAAQKAEKERAELKKEFNDKAKAAGEGITELAKEANDVTSAEAKFVEERDQRIRGLRAIHAIRAQIPTYLGLALANSPLTERGKAMVSEKIAVLEMRVTEAARGIEDLQFASSTDWQTRNQATSETMIGLDAAVQDALDTLRDAPRLPETSS